MSVVGAVPCSAPLRFRTCKFPSWCSSRKAFSRLSAGSLLDQAVRDLGRDRRLRRLDSGHAPGQAPRFARSRDDQLRGLGAGRWLSGRPHAGRDLLLPGPDPHGSAFAVPDLGRPVELRWLLGRHHRRLLVEVALQDRHFAVRGRDRQLVSCGLGVWSHGLQRRARPSGPGE